jgi:hypothetical protein
MTKYRESKPKPLLTSANDVRIIFRRAQILQGKGVLPVTIQETDAEIGMDYVYLCVFLFVSGLLHGWGNGRYDFLCAISFKISELLIQVLTACVR